MFDDDIYLYVTSAYSMFGNGRCNELTQAAATRLEERMDRNKTIQVIEVRRRPRNLTLEERKAIYLKERNELQARVLKRAGDNPECFLSNSYTNVCIVPESMMTHDFLDELGIRRTT